MLLLYLLTEIHEDLGRLIDMRLTAWAPNNLMKSLVYLHDTKAVSVVPCSVGREDIPTARFSARNSCQ